MFKTQQHRKGLFTLWLLLAAVAATAQSEPTPPEFEYSDLQRLTPEDYIDMQLPPLHVLMENAALHRRLILLRSRNRGSSAN